MRFEGKIALPTSKYQGTINAVIDALSALPKELRWPVSKGIVRALTSDEGYDKEFWKERISEVVVAVTEDKPELMAFKQKTLKVAYVALREMAKMPPKVQHAIGVRHCMTELASGSLPEGKREPELKVVPIKPLLVWPENPESKT